MKGEESPSLQPRLNIVIANVAKQSLACFLAGSSATLSSGCSNAAPAKPCKASAAAMLAWLWSSRRGFCNARLTPPTRPNTQTPCLTTGYLKQVT